jgi:hypothetical protein
MRNLNNNLHRCISIDKDNDIKSKFEEFEKESMEFKKIFIAIKFSAEGKRENNNG